MWKWNAGAVLVQDDTRLGAGEAKLAMIHQLTRTDCQIFSLQSEGELKLEAGESKVLKVVTQVVELQRKWMGQKISQGEETHL